MLFALLQFLSRWYIWRNR